MNPTNWRDRMGTSMIAPALLAGASTLLCVEMTPSSHASASASHLEHAVDRPFDAAVLRFEFADGALVPTLDESTLEGLAKSATDGRLTALRIDGAPLRFDDLLSGERSRLRERYGDDAAARYEAGIARQVAHAMARVRETNRDATMTVIGLPFERHSGDAASIAKSNGRYESVMKAMDAVIIERNVMVAGPDDGSQLARIYPNAVGLASDKPVLYRVNGSWNARVPEPSGDARAAATNGGSRDAATPMARPGGLGGAKSAGTSAGSSSGRSISIGGGKSSGGALVRGGGSLGASRGGARSAGGVQAIRAGADDGSNPELDALMRAWGTNDPAWDLDGNGIVDGRDLAILLGGMTDEPEGDEEGGESGGGNAGGDNVGSGRVMLRGTGGESEEEGDEGDRGSDGGDGGDAGGGDGGASGGGDGGAGGGAGGGGDPSAGPVMVPGAGFAGEPEAADRRGIPSDVGYERQAIARWNAVPFQDVNASFEVGVIAYHISGISHVEFQLAGGETVIVSEPSLNPRTNTEEYWVRLDPTLLDDAHYELRAVAVPNAGEPRVLAGPITGAAVRLGEVSFHFTANDGGGLPDRVAYVAPPPIGSDTAGDGSREHPYATLIRGTYALAADETYGDVGGGELRLLAGEYNLGTYAWPYAVKADHRWMTIRAAEGVDEHDVRIVSSSPGGLRVPKLRLLDVRVTPAPGELNVLRGNNEETIWVDDCSIIGETQYPDLATRSILTGFTGGIYATDVTIKDIITTPFNGALERNVHIDGLLERAFGSRLIVNCSVKNLRSDLYTETAFHPDVWQLFVPEGLVENCITVGLESTESVYAQGLFFSGHTALFKDIVFDDVRVDTTWNGDPDAIFVNFHAFEAFEHVLVIDSEFKGGGRYVEPGTPHGSFVATDSVFCRVRHLDSEVPFVPHPDGPTSWTEGRWPGTLPWTSPSGLNYTLVGPWEDTDGGPSSQ